MHTKRTRVHASAILCVAALLLGACASAIPASKPATVPLTRGDDVAVFHEGREITYRQLDRLLGTWTGRAVEALSGEELSALRIRAAQLLRASGDGPWILESVPAVESPWHHSRDAATEQARATGRPILIDYTGTHSCLRCVRLRREILASPEFERWAADRFVLLRSSTPWRGFLRDDLDETDPALVWEYHDHPAPAVLVLDARGRVIARSGYRRGGPTPWIGNLAGKLEPMPVARHSSVVRR